MTRRTSALLPLSLLLALWTAGCGCGDDEGGGDADADTDSDSDSDSDTDTSSADCDDDTDCDDNNACNGEQTCVAGTCTGGTPVDCTALDGDCTIGTCDNGTGDCTAEPWNEGEACGGDLCTTGGTCVAGTCTGTAVDCTALDDDCNTGSCDPATGDCIAEASNEGGGCDDGDLCTDGDTCAAGACGGTAVDCSSLDNSCNIGECDAGTGGCVATPTNEGRGCDDGSFCTSSDTCAAGTCTGTDVDCSAFDDICNVGTCNPADGTCAATAANEGGACDDSDVCTESDICTRGACAGTAIGNDCDIYQWRLGGFVDISQSSTATTLAAISADNADDDFDTVVLPFTFDFFGEATDTIHPATNGVIGVGVGNETTEYDNAGVLPDAALPNSFIAPFWDDLYSVAGVSDVWYDVRGISPNQVAIVQWKRFGRFGATSTRLDFEVAIHEGGLIQYLYDVSTNGSGVGNEHRGTSATVGIENAAGDVGDSFSIASDAIPPGLIIDFTPDGAGGYLQSNESNLVGQWIDARAGTLAAAASNCDDCSSAVALPFAFTFYGTLFGPGTAATNLNVLSNGNVQFGNTPSTAFGNVNLPSAAAGTPKNMIACLWDDLDTRDATAAGSNIYTLTSGVTPNRRFVIQWVDVPFLGEATSDTRFQIILYETTNRIDCLYGPSSAGTNRAAGVSATAGLNNVDGTVGASASFNVANLGQGAAISFVPSSNSSTAAYAVSGPHNEFPELRWSAPSTSTAADGDDVFEVVALGFDFSFYGTTYSDVAIESNGFLHFLGGSGEFTNSGLPDGLDPNAVIAPFWDDLLPTTNPGEVYYLTSGGAGDHVFTVQWQSINAFGLAAGTGMDATFAVQLHEATGEIMTYYGGMTGVAQAQGNSCTVGIENENGLSGVEAGFDNGGTTLSGSRFVFTPP